MSNKALKINSKICNKLILFKQLKTKSNRLQIKIKNRQSKLISKTNNKKKIICNKIKQILNKHQSKNFKNQQTEIINIINTMSHKLFKKFLIKQQ